MMNTPPLGRKFRHLFFSGTGTPVRADLACVPICESEFTSLICRLNKLINYTVRTRVRLFVSLRGQSGGSLTCFLSVNKKSNYYQEKTRRRKRVDWKFGRPTHGRTKSDVTIPIVSVKPRSVVWGLTGHYSLVCFSVRTQYNPLYFVTGTEG